MKLEKLYKNLKNAAENIGIKIYEQNFKKIKIGVKVKSGLCKLKGQSILIIDKNYSLKDKIDIAMAYIKEDTKKFT